MTKTEILRLFTQSGARLEGHFLLTSGKHSGEYMQCAKLFVEPKTSKQLCSALADKLKELKIDYVVSPAIGGIVMGYEMACQLGCKNYFAERGSDNEFTLRRGFEIKKGDKVLIVEDVVTTGGSVKEVIALMEQLGAEIIGVASIVDRSNGKVDFGYPYFSLLSLDIKAYEKENCPLCKEDIPLVKPGSRKIS